jgi:hypothetical protein
MQSKRKIMQLAAVTMLAAFGSVATAEEVRWDEYCSTSCAGVAVCEPAGGQCFNQDCLGIDEQWYEYLIICFPS